jgi:hypothetical protein
MSANGPAPAASAIMAAPAAVVFRRAAGRRMLPRFILVLCLALADGVPARAADAIAPGPAAQIEARGGLGRRDDTLVVTPADVRARGSTSSNLELRASWFPGAGRAGLVGWFASEWFTLRAMDEGWGADGVAGAGGFAGVALAFRARAGAWTGQGQLGYGGVQIPVLLVAPPTIGFGLSGGEVRAHGPTLALAGRWQPARVIAFEVVGDVLPLAFGARYGGEDIGVRRWRLGVTAVTGDVAAGAARLAAVISYEQGHTGATGDAIDIQQAHAQIGFGVRASFPQRAGRPEPRPPAVPASAQKQGDGRLTILARQRSATGGETEVAVAGLQVEVIAGDGARRGPFTTDARGALVLRDLPAGPIDVRLGGPGWEPAREILAFPARGAASATVFVARARAAPPVPASVAITGLVRSDRGTPVPARVRIVELGLERQADANGGFRFDLPPGRYSLTVEAPGFVGQRRIIEAGNTEQQIYDIELKTERP